MRYPRVFMSPMHTMISSEINFQCDFLIISMLKAYFRNFTICKKNVWTHFNRKVSPFTDFLVGNVFICQVNGYFTKPMKKQANMLMIYHYQTQNIFGHFEPYLWSQ